MVTAIFNLLLFPNCVSYDPAYVYEVAVILQDGINRMYGEKQEDVFYYITTLNETYEQPAMPKAQKKVFVKVFINLKPLKRKATKAMFNY